MIIRMIVAILMRRKAKKIIIYKALPKKKRSPFSLISFGAFLLFATISVLFFPQETIAAPLSPHAATLFDLQYVTATTSSPATNSAVIFPQFSEYEEVVSDPVTISPTPSSSDDIVQLEPTPLPTDYCLTVPVLMYHHIEPLQIANDRGHGALTIDSDIFDQQMNYLVSAGYTTLSADQLVQAIITHEQLPEKSVVITLDDGYDDWYTYAFPIAQKYNVTLNLMISSGLINNKTYMTWDQLKEMSESPLIKIYNHTWSHTALGQVSKEKIESEIVTANNQLESNLGIKIDILTYPYGSYNDLAIATLKEHGFVAAFTTVEGTYHCESNLLTLSRVRVGNAPLSYYGL
jgi:peptidoglycan/xylan/chitin deacetylase (PgdA/CDA1 family)